MTEHLGSSHGSGVTYAITRMYLTTLIHRMCRRLLWLRRELAASDGLPRCSQRKILIGIQKKMLANDDNRIKDSLDGCITNGRVISGSH